LAARVIEPALLEPAEHAPAQARSDDHQHCRRDEDESAASHHKLTESCEHGSSNRTAIEY
jgi:hypothetical protein